MNLASTIKMMAEKKDAPPFDVSKKDYEGASKELTDYAKKSGGIDKNDFLKIANQISALGKSKSPTIGARMMRNVAGLDTDVREKIFTVLKKYGLKEELECDMEALEEAKVQGKEVFDKTFANRTQADNFAQKNGGRVKQVGRVFYVFKEAPEDNEPASPDEGSMAMQQLEFIEYAAEEIGDHIKAGGKFPEWMQNKLATVNDNMQSLHSQIDHEEIEDDEPEEMDEGKSSTGYELYHKDFSSAMKHAYDHAKKKFGIEVDPKEIDDKVASGPRKPSKGKTNSYRLKGKDGKKAVQIQVYGMDNGKYELNMYKESVEMDEAFKVGDKVKAKKGSQANNQRHYERKVGTIVKDYKDGDFKVNFGGNDDASIAGKDLVKESVELQESPMVTTSIPNNQSDHVAKLQRLAKENGVEFSRQGRTVTLKGKRIDVQTIFSKMAYAGGSQPKMVLVKEEVELTEREDTAMQVAREILKMGVRQSAPENEILKRIPFALKKLGLANDKLIKRDPDFAGDVIGDFRGMKEEVELDEAMRVLATKGKTKVVTKGDGVARVMVGNKEIASGDLDDGAGGWFMSKTGEKGQKFFDSPKKIVDFYAEEVEIEEAYKTPSEASAYEAGKKAARQGKKYQDNPNKKGTAEFTAWSKGHNEARAKKLNAQYEEVDFDGLFESTFEEEKLSLEDTFKAIWEGKKLDPVNKKALKKDFDDRKDKDIDNDGDVDDSDEYMHNKRKAIGKSMEKDSDEAEAEQEKEVSDKEDEPKKDVGKSKKQTKVDVNPSIDEEAEMTDAQMKKREEIVKSMKDKMPEFEKKYGDRAKDVMYATATKLAMKKA